MTIPGNGTRSNAAAGTLDATNFGKYDQLVRACLATGAKCIIDVHNYARFQGIYSPALVILECAHIRRENYRSGWTNERPIRKPMVTDREAGKSRCPSFCSSVLIRSPVLE
jgi:hypothetical protein